MDAWVVDKPGPVDTGPLARVEKDVPDPGPGQVRVCRCAPVASAAPTCTWPRAIFLRATRGSRRATRSSVWSTGSAPGSPPAGSWATASASRGSPTPAGCAASASAGRENLCIDPRFTGWDSTAATPTTPSWTRTTRTRCPTRSTTSTAAPLLCAGIIGYRALPRANLPEGGRLGIYGFGGSAHLTAQIALARGRPRPRHDPLGRGPRLALELGAASAGHADAPPPEPLDSAILFAPVGTLVPPALAALDRGGTLAVAGIYLSDVPPLTTQDHLFEERTLQSVTANTRRDGEAFLAEAARHRHPGLGHALPDGSGRRGAARPGPRPRQRRRRPRALTSGPIRPARAPGRTGDDTGFAGLRGADGAPAD